MEKNNSAPIKQKTKLDKILSRPQIKIQDYLTIEPIKEKLNAFSKEAVEQAEILIKYNGYIAREKETAILTKLENIQIPQTFDYRKIRALSSESKEKLSAIAPSSIGQASRISGVTPSDINILLVYMGR